MAIKAFQDNTDNITIKEYPECKCLLNECHFKPKISSGTPNPQNEDREDNLT